LLSPDKIAVRDADEWGSETGSEVSLDFERLIAIGRRQWRVVALSAAASVFLAIGYVLTAVPLYTADTTVLIDRSKSNIVDQLSAMGGVDADEATVLSQVELLRSDTIAGAVVAKLQLASTR